PLGRSDNYPRSVAGRIAASPARAVLEVSGGQAPQHLVNEFAAVIARGGSEVTLIFGSEAISTIEHFARAQDRPDFAEHAEGSLGAAVLLMSVAAARRLGVLADRWVFLHGHADLREREPLERADLSAGPASALAVRHALALAGIGADALATIDLYSCFPAPVF